MSSTEAEEEKAKNDAVTRVTTSAFPDAHLPPWMSNYNFKIMVALSKMATIARIAEKADKNRWRDLHPGEPLPDYLKAGEEKDQKMAEEFDVDLHARGAAAAYAYGVNALVQEVHDRAVSVGGLGRRQGIAVGIGVSTRGGAGSVAEFDTPAKKHFWSRTPKQETAGLR
jgi:hypothetical protein